MNIFDSQSISMKESERRKISSFIETKFGIKMPSTKRALLISRLSKRLLVLGMKSFEEYFKYINSPDGLTNEIYIFVDLVSTHETTFFRESQHFDILLSKVLPKITHEYGAGIKRPLRILSAACSTGEEAYSLAIIITEFIKLNNYFDFQYIITGADISLRVLETARRGVYEARRIKNVTKQYRKNYFMKNKNKKIDLVRVIPELRTRLEFFPINLMNEIYPFEFDFDVIFLKNALIYFDRKNQIEICLRILKHLVSGGYFFVGLSESMTGLGLPLKSVMPSVFRKY
jgi:chemotaxis protein methyltransferase CheR